MGSPTFSQGVGASDCPRGTLENSPAFQRRVQPGVETPGYSQAASPRRFSRSALGLTLLEMMVAMALLTVIVLGLTAMFLQTQKAFKSGMRQVDILEGGRSVIGMMTRDLEQMADANSTNIVNFCVEPDINPAKVCQVESTFTRTNELQHVFALRKENTKWIAVDYFVEPPSANVRVGTLYRSMSSTNGILRDNALFTRSIINFNRVADGVIHFKIRAFDTNGFEVPFSTPTTAVKFPNPPDLIFAALPSYLEIELGILEPETFEQVRSLGNNSVAINNFLRSRMSKVQIFRQQVPIRAAATR